MAKHPSFTCHQATSKDDFVSSLLLSALNKYERRFPMWAVSKSSVESKIKWTVKSPSKVVKRIMWEAQCVNVSWHLLPVSGASALIPLLLLRGSKGRITPSSKSLFHLHPITPSSGVGGGKREQHKQTGVAVHASISSLAPFVLLILLSSTYFRGPVSPLWP